MEVQKEIRPVIVSIIGSPTRTLLSDLDRQTREVYPPKTPKEIAAHIERVKELQRRLIG